MLGFNSKDTKQTSENIFNNLCKLCVFVVNYTIRINLKVKYMANEYLIDIHNYISAQIAFTEACQVEAQEKNDKASQLFYEGQLAEWQYIRTYLAEKVDLKTQKYF